MEEELGILLGKKVSANMIIHLLGVKNMEQFGILNANKIFIMLAAVFVHLIALVDGLILEFPAKNLVVMEEELDIHVKFYALIIKMII